MAEETAWRVRLRQRVASAEEDLREADAALQLVQILFQTPTPPEAAAQGHATRVAAFHSKITLAMEWLMDATLLLNSAVAHMEAAELLALRGGNDVNPAVPLPSIQHLAWGAGPAVFAAMSRLQISRMFAADACTVIRWGRGHLSTAVALIDALGIPEQLGHAEWEFGTAVNALTVSTRMAQAALGEFTAALQFLAP